ncbi:MAG: hypothetical protein AB1555_06540 [Nitrospirota bacterium]
MRCWDHIDMAVMAGAITTVGSAVVLMAYLGLDRGPLTQPAPPVQDRWLEETLSQAINEAVVTPARVTEERERTQVALGDAIKRLTQVKVATETFVPNLAKDVARGALARREFLESVFKLPSDWKSQEFFAMRSASDAMAQEALGRRIVSGARTLFDDMAKAEVNYGQAVVAAVLAMDRAAKEPAASTATLLAASTVMSELAKRVPAVPEPIVTREPGWGFGSIGDGTVLPILMAAAALCVLAAAGMGLRERGPSVRTITMLCDEHKRDVTVEMLVSDDTPYEVVRCSAFNGGPVTCDKHCVLWPTARAVA